jgi:hypothetical protein
MINTSDVRRLKQVARRFNEEDRRFEMFEFQGFQLPIPLSRPDSMRVWSLSHGITGCSTEKGVLLVSRVADAADFFLFFDDAECGIGFSLRNESLVRNSPITWRRNIPLRIICVNHDQVAHMVLVPGVSSLELSKVIFGGSTTQSRFQHDARMLCKVFIKHTVGKVLGDQLVEIAV